MSMNWDARRDFDVGSRRVIARIYAAEVRARNFQMQVKRAAPRRDPFDPEGFLFELHLLRVHSSY